MINRRTLQDRDFKTIGYVETRDDGTEVLTDPNFRTRGYYDPRRGVTTDENFRTVGQGNLLLTLLAAEAVVTRTKQSQENKNSRAGGLMFLVVAALILFAAVLIFCPGLVLVAFVRSLFLPNWTAVQMWTFGVASAVVIWLGLYGATRNVRRGTIGYLILCVTVLAVFAFSHFGLQTKFTANALAWYLPPENRHQNATGDTPQVNHDATPFVDLSASRVVAQPSPSPSATIVRYRVNGFTRSDSLNVREGPASTNRVVAKLPADTGGIELQSGRVRNGTTVWQQISVNGLDGWVNADYLTPEQPTDTSQ